MALQERAQPPRGEPILRDDGDVALTVCEPYAYLRCGLLFR